MKNIDWLTQHGWPRAHAFIDEAEKAVCGYELLFECEECGQDLKVYGQGKKSRCGACERALAEQAMAGAQAKVTP